MLKQKILLIWADYWTQHITKTAIKLLVGILIFGGTTSALITANPTPKPAPATHPVKVQKLSHSASNANASKKAPATEPPKPTTPTPTPANTVNPSVVTTKPQPIPASSPTPGTGAKSLVPTSTPTASATPAPAATSPSSDPATPATGGYASTNWAGYVALNAKFTTVSGSWKATTASGNGSTTTADSTWIGIGGTFTGDLIQTGTTNIIAANGTVSTYAFYELLPDSALFIPSLHVTPGDNMNASISETSPSQWLIRITDVTTGQSFSTNVTYSSSYSSAEWIEEDPSYASGTLVPFAHFGSAFFSSASMTANGILANLDSNSGRPITLVSNSGTPLAVPSVLTGNSFSVTQQ